LYPSSGRRLAKRSTRPRRTIRASWRAESFFSFWVIRQ
jgi:hypothetical protein